MIVYLDIDSSRSGNSRYLIIIHFIIVAEIEGKLLFMRERQDGLLQFHGFKITVIDIFVCKQPENIGYYRL